MQQEWVSFLLLFCTGTGRKTDVYRDWQIIWSRSIQAKNDFAENLSNIAHQIKTLITAISLSAQTMQKEYGSEKLGQIKKQLLRLTRLEEALLILSRLDAGILCAKNMPDGGACFEIRFYSH